MESDNLPEEFKAGLISLQNRTCPEARVVCVDGNFAWVYLGSLDLKTLELAYAEEECQLFARVPLTFPNADPYGIATVPRLHRKDGGAIERQHKKHQHANRLCEIPEFKGASFWSWEWKGVKRARAEDLSDLYEWAAKRIRQES